MKWIYKPKQQRLHLQFRPYHVLINSLKLLTVVSALISIGKRFHICGPKHLMLLSPKVTELGIMRLKSDLWGLFLCSKRFFIKIQAWS